MLRDEQAIRRNAIEFDATGELRKYDVLHFATHAILDSQAPHPSRELLSDEALTIMDVLELSLDARLVTLSATGELKRLLDLYLSGSFPKETLLEHQARWNRPSPISKGNGGKSSPISRLSKLPTSTSPS